MDKLSMRDLAGIIRITPIFGMVLMAGLFNSAQGSEINDEQVVECFFVYAPLLEAAKNSGSAHLFYYAQKRIGWAGGYVQAKQNDASFNEIFQKNLNKNKQNAIHLRSRMISAIKNQDKGVFTEVINIAKACDQMIGLPSENILFP